MKFIFHRLLISVPKEERNTLQMIGTKPNKWLRSYSESEQKDFDLNSYQKNLNV